jgi:hypothetical protein
VPAPPAEEVRQAAARAIAFLREEQRPSGEFPSVAAPLGEPDPAWEEDTLTFITALVVLAMARQPQHPATDVIIGSAVSFLDREREPGGQWRYWARAHERHHFTPPDADDTACVSMALNGQGRSTDENRRLLLANRDDEGRFYTWLVLHRPWPRNPVVWWRLRRELGAQRARQELWESTEAEPGDVDGVVNANVIRYLGADAPTAAVEYVARLIEQDRETGCDSWHHSPYALYASVADGYRRGVRRFGDLAEAVEQKIAARLQPDGTVGAPLDTALALAALVAFERQGPALELVRGLVETQRADGSWARSVCYYGGPQEVFGWASDALTAATAAAALSGAEALWL